jgi:hypothetical protein
MQLKLITNHTYKYPQLTGYLAIGIWHLSQAIGHTHIQYSHYDWYSEQRPILIAAVCPSGEVKGKISNFPKNSNIAPVFRDIKRKSLVNALAVVQTPTRSEPLTSFYTKKLNVRAPESHGLPDPFN